MEIATSIHIRIESHNRNSLTNSIRRIAGIAVNQMHEA